MDNWLSDLMGCPFCLAYHIPVALMLMCFLPAFFLPEPYAGLFKLPLYCLAATDVVHIIRGDRQVEEDDEDP